MSRALKWCSFPLKPTGRLSVDPSAALPPQLLGHFRRKKFMHRACWMCILFLWKKFAHTAWCNSLWISCSSPQNRLWRKNPHHRSAFDSYPHNFVLLPLLLQKPMEWYKYLLLFYKETNMVLTSLWIKTEISDKNKQYSTAGWKPCADSKRCSQVGAADSLFCSTDPWQETVAQ